MKIYNNNYNFFIFALFGFLALSMVSCDNENNEDTIPPGKLTVKDIISTNGGAKISYSLPDDNDILFVRAQYTTTLGNEVFKASSYYNDTIEVDGFDDTSPQTIKLFVIDRDNNSSESVEAQITPLESFIHLVQNSVAVSPELGGVRVSWENISGKTVHVKMIINSIHGQDSIIISSYLEYYSTVFRGLDSVNYEFLSSVEDVHKNNSGTKLVGNVKPKFEQKIDKKSWSLVSDLSVDGNAWEGLTENFWDDVIDTKDSPDDNSYFIINRDDNGGSLSYPLDIVIDLGKKVIVNRFQVWQRAYSYSAGDGGVSDDYYYYKVENMRVFEIYTSNDKLDWFKVGEFDIGDPKDDDGNVAPEYIQEAIDGHMFSLENATEPFQYLKFSITSSFGSETNVYGSEISLFGLDNVEE